MAGVLVWLGGDLQEWLDASVWERVLRCALCVFGGAGVYFAALYVLGLRYRHIG
jgi:putative peptidoglycan lipid II flippase